jgi:hypothetical protein
MQCLYCGRVLALLTPLGGEGEFCSDEHRQKYRKETDLTFNRLLQARRPEGVKFSAGSASTGEPPKESKPLERRDFVAAPWVVDIALHATGESESLPSGHTVRIPILPRPPQDSPIAWQAPKREFPVPSAELGQPACLVFEIAGFEQKQEKEDAAAIPEQRMRLSGPVRQVPIDPVRLEPAIVKPVPGEPTHIERIHVEPATPPVSATGWVVPPAQQGPASGPGRPIQVFSSALAPATEVAVTPREATISAKDEPESVRRTGPDPRFAKLGDRRPRTTTFPPAPRPQHKPGPEPPEVSAVGKGPAVEAAPKIRPVEDKSRIPVVTTEPQPVRQEGSDKQPSKAAPKIETMNEPLFSKPLATPGTELDFALPTLRLELRESFWSRLPAAGKAGLVVVIVAVVGGAGYFAMSGGYSGSQPEGAGDDLIMTGPAAWVGNPGWNTDWAADSPSAKRGRRISILRTVFPFDDYRVEIQGRIENKAIGWVFRAMSPENYYVTKLEVVKPGLEPTLALVRFAVIGGEDQPRAQLPLALKVRHDTLYKIRFDVVGHRFTTWVQDTKVDEWTDDKIATGGIGLLYEREESASLEGNVSVVPLVMKK